MQSVIKYRLEKNAWREFPVLIKNWIIKTNSGVICDIGGGANPTVDLDFVESRNLDYTIMDISRSEMEKAPALYKKLVQNIEADDFAFDNCFDLAFSQMLVEHVKNGKVFHQNVFQMLKPRGIAIHYFPTLFALPFVVNKLIPEVLSSLLLNIFTSRVDFHHGKFPAYYDWCFGPTSSMLSFIKTIGFEVIEFNALIGHVYFQKIPIVRIIHQMYSNRLLRYPNPYLTSFAQIVLRKAS